MNRRRMIHERRPIRRIGQRSRKRTGRKIKIRMAIRTRTRRIRMARKADRSIANRAAKHSHKGDPMETVALVLPLAAIGYSLLYLLLGGGLVGAIVIFILAKMLGR